MINRKYLEDIDINFEDTPNGFAKYDERYLHWEEQRKIYGFDERDTWNLEYTIDLLLYERLCMYKEYAMKFLDLDFHKITMEDTEINILECLTRMIEGLMLKITLDDLDEKRNEPKNKKLIDDVYVIYNKCKRFLWW